MTDLAPEQAVDGYLDAIATGDFALARSFLSDENFSYKSPIGVYDNADEFIQSVVGVAGILEGIERRRRFVDGNEVFDVLNFRTRMSEATDSAVVQWAIVENGKIASLEAFFDAHEYKMMFQGG